MKKIIFTSIFSIDKTTTFDIVVSSILRKFLFQKGAMDEERPLKFTSSFRILLYKLSSGCNFKYPSDLKVLRAFQKNKFHYEFNPKTEAYS